MTVLAVKYRRDRLDKRGRGRSNKRMGMNFFLSNFSKAAYSVNETTPVGATDGIKGVAAKPSPREASTGSVNQHQQL